MQPARTSGGLGAPISGLPEILAQFFSFNFANSLIWAVGSSVFDRCSGSAAVLLKSDFSQRSCANAGAPAPVPATR
jgi:hypothetical protein